MDLGVVDVVFVVRLVMMMTGDNQRHEGGRADRLDTVLDHRPTREAVLLCNGAVGASTLDAGLGDPESARERARMTTAKKRGRVSLLLRCGVSAWLSPVSTAPAMPCAGLSRF
jgi:hypothetical protein